MPTRRERSQVLRPRFLTPRAALYLKVATPGVLVVSGANADEAANVPTVNKREMSFIAMIWTTSRDPEDKQQLPQLASGIKYCGIKILNGFI